MTIWRNYENVTVNKSVDNDFIVCKTFLQFGIEFAPLFFQRGLFTLFMAKNKWNQ